MTIHEALCIGLLYLKVSAEQDCADCTVWNLCIILEIHTLIMTTLQVRVATKMIRLGNNVME